MRVASFTRGLFPGCTRRLRRRADGDRPLVNARQRRISPFGYILSKGVRHPCAKFRRTAKNLTNAKNQCVQRGLSPRCTTRAVNFAGEGSVVREALQRGPSPVVTHRGVASVFASFLGGSSQSARGGKRATGTVPL